MKILHVSKKYPGAVGGDANVVYTLQSCQKRAGHEVTVLTTHCLEIAEDKNVIKCGIPDNSKNYDRITPKRIVSLLIFFFSSFDILPEVKPDVIHSHSPDMGFLISIPAKIFRIPIIHTCHGICFNDRSFPFLKRRMELFLLKYGGFRCITTVDKNSLTDFIAQDIRNVVYIPNGVDLSLFSPAQRPAFPAAMKFLCVGRLERQKGLDVLIDAAAQLRKVKTNFSVTIIGDGSLKKDLMQYIFDHSLDSTVQITGTIPRDELVRKYFESNAFILPSRWEGMPLTLLEAWAAGLPSIVTNVGGLTTICEDMENAIVIGPGDSRALCHAMRFMMENPETAQKLGSEGNRIARTHYSWDSIGKLYEEVYCRLVHDEGIHVSR